MMLLFCGGDVSSSIHLLGIHFCLFLLKQVYLHNGCYNSASVLSLFTKVMFVLWPKEKIDVRTNQYLGNLPYPIAEFYVWPRSDIQGKRLVWIAIERSDKPSYLILCAYFIHVFVAIFWSSKRVSNK